MSEEVKSRGHGKTRVGVVVSDKMDKTVVVRVDRTTQHPVLKKVLTRGKRYHVHDAENALKVGDKVKIVETRPLSKIKRWRLGEVLSRSAG